MHIFDESISVSAEIMAFFLVYNTKTLFFLYFSKIAASGRINFVSVNPTETLDRGSFAKNHYFKYKMHSFICLLSKLMTIPLS